jgi:hypothetical protein
MYWIQYGLRAVVGENKSIYRICKALIFPQENQRFTNRLIDLRPTMVARHLI